MKLIIEDDEGRKTVVPLVRDEISIGRLEGNTIRLTERNVSRRHARLVRQNGAVYVEDLGSYTGVRVNGERIDGRSTVKEGDLIEIGDYDLQIEGAPSKGRDADTNPTVKDDYPHLQPPADKTPPLAVPSPVPEKKTTPAQPAAQPAAPRKSDANATAVIRLSDLQRSGGGVDERDLAANEAPRLVGLSGGFRGKELVLRRSVMKVGRTDDGNDLVVDHQSISRSHGKFQLEDGGWKLYDNKSANGVRVNGEEYGMSPVKPGDTIELGHVKFRFCAPGERFVPPAEAAPSVQASAPSAQGQASRHDDQAPAKNKTGLIAGVVGAVVLVAAVGVFFATKKPAIPRDENGRTAEEKCVAGQQLIVEKKWPEAMKELQGAKALGTTGKCEVEKLIGTAKTEADAKAQLDEGVSLLEARKYKRAIAELTAVPGGSMYGAEAKLKISEAREQGVKALSEDAQKALETNKIDDAKNAIEDLQSLSPDAPTLPLLQKAFADKKAAAQKASAAPVKEEKKEEPVEVRNAKAEPLLKGANDKIRGGDLSGGIADLQAVIAIHPDTAYMGKAYRNLGVASARAGKTDDAIKYYKQYLNLMPDAPERAQLEKLFSDYEKQKGGR